MLLFLNTEKLKAYDILLYRGSGFTSWLIQVSAKSRYSHVAVVVDPKISLGIESNVGHRSGVRAMDLRKAPEDEVDVFRIKPEFAFDGNQVISFLVGHLGAKYDKIGVVWLGVLKAASFVTFGEFKGHNAFQIQKDYFCSELVYEAFNQAGLDIVPQISEAGVTSPGDIARSKCLEKVKSKYR